MKLGNGTGTSSIRSTKRCKSDNEPEFVVKAVREWIAAVGAKTAFNEPGSPSATARASTRSFATNCSTARSSTASPGPRYTERPHSSLGYQPPAPEAIAWPSKPARSLPPAAQAMAEKPIIH
jgi:transposase InsO family protein